MCFIFIHENRSNLFEIFNSIKQRKLCNSLASTNNSLHWCMKVEGIISHWHCKTKASFSKFMTKKMKKMKKRRNLQQLHFQIKTIINFNENLYTLRTARHI